MINKLQNIINAFPEDVNQFIEHGELDECGSFYDSLFYFYSTSGDMPYSVVKARDGDPLEWVSDQLSNFLSIN